MKTITREAALALSVLALALLACKKDKSSSPGVEATGTPKGGSVTVTGDQGSIKLQGGAEGGTVSVEIDGGKVELGNTGGDCKPGQPCVCSAMGNCSKSCAGPGCEFSASGMGNTTFKCPDGKCSAKSTAIGNVTLECKGGGCTL